MGDTRYEATEPALFIAAKPSEAVVNYIDLHPKEGQDYIALKFVDSVTKAPITIGISCWFSSSVKTIFTDYQGIAHISGTYDSKVVISVRRDGYTEYNQSYDNLANHSVTTIELVPESTTKEYFVFAVTEKNAPVETVTAASVLVDDEWIPQDLRTVVASIGFNYTAIPGTVIKVKFVATGFITEEIDVTLQTESDESLIVPVTLRFEDGIDYMQIEGDGIEHPIFRVGDVESN